MCNYLGVVGIGRFLPRGGGDDDSGRSVLNDCVTHETGVCDGGWAWEREGARDKATKKKREQGPAIHACCLLEALVPYTRHTKLVCMHKLSGSGLTATMGAQKSSHNRSWSEDGRNRVLTTA